MTLRALCNLLLLPVVALATCAASPAIAAWPNSPLVNVPVCTAMGDQLGPTGIPDGAGGTIVAWFDERAGIGNGDIYAQRISATGTPLWAASGVALCTAGGEQTVPVILSDGTGGAIVAWLDRRNSSWNLYAQRISADGSVQWTADGVALCTPTASQVARASIASDGLGGAIVTWFDVRSGSWDVYAQRISAAGALQWTAGGVVLCAATNDQDHPSIAPDGAGGAIVAWEDGRSGYYTDIYAQRISANGTVQWTANGVALCIAPNYQLDTTTTSDGAGGAIVTWMDERSGTGDIYAQRISAVGAVQWTANGVALCTATSHQYAPTVASDGAGGTVVTWVDYRSGTNYDIYAQRISAAGTAQWTADGVALCTAAYNQGSPTVAPDGQGGAIVTWTDHRSGGNSGDPDTYAQRISATGVIQWAADGVALGTATGAQEYGATISDGAGGAIVVWIDDRNAGYYDLYAQRVDRWGHLGVQPTIVNVRDVPNDQGGQVSVFWNASPLDSFPAYSITDYWIWRQVPSALAQSALARGARLLPDGATPADAPRGVFRTTTSGTTTFYWELVDAQIAQGFPGYSYVASTTCDSVGTGNPRTVFMVEARGALTGQWWFSDPDSGYSVDNLAPAAPSPFTGSYLGGTTTLSWGASSATDFSVFRLYRGASTAFVPGPGNLIRTQTGTGYVDIAGTPYIYKLTAVDIHGNESAATTLQPSGTADADATALHELALSAPAPNPLRGSCTMRLALPREALVSLAVFDQQGRRVRTLLAGALPAGEHPFVWDGRDDGGRPVASALYFVRLETAGRAISRRLVVVR